MSRAIVGNRRCGEVVPPLARGALGKEGVRVRKKGGVGEGFLATSQPCDGVSGLVGEGAYRVVLPRALPLPQVLHLLWLELVQ